MSIRIEDVNKMSFVDITEAGAEMIPPTLPGDILLHDFLQPLNLSANVLAKALHVPANRITSILKGQRGITADTALRLSRCLGTTAQFWTNLQASYDLKIAIHESGEKIRSEVISLAS